MFLGSVFSKGHHSISIKKFEHQTNGDDFDENSNSAKKKRWKNHRFNNFFYLTFGSRRNDVFLNATVKSNSCRYWSYENFRIYHEVHTQHRQKLNVCDNLNGETYLELLQEVIEQWWKLLKSKIDINSILDDISVGWSHSPLFSRSTEYLYKTYPFDV